MHTLRSSNLTGYRFNTSIQFGRVGTLFVPTTTIALKRDWWA